MTSDGNPHKEHRLLLVAPNWLGDVVMFTSMLGRLSTAGTDQGKLHITVAVRRKWEAILAGDPRIDQLLFYEREGLHRGLGGLLRLARDWRAQRFDEVILAPPSLRVAAVSFLAGIPRRIGFRSDGRSWLLTHPVPMPERGSIPYIEELDLLASAGSVTGLSVQPPSPALPGLSTLEATVPATGDAEIWALGLGATYGEAKAWPDKHLQSFVELVLEDPGRRILLLGDAQASAAATRLSASSDRVINKVGATDLLGVASLLKGSRLYVGNDSGLMHLAAAMGVPTVGLFGSTSPVWTGPSGRWTAVARAEGFDCQPCYLRRCNQDVFCMDHLEPGTVLAKALDLLAQADGTRAGCHRRVESADVKPTLFVDRDGVIIEDAGYIKNPDDVHLLPGAADGLNAAADAGYRLVCLTNQSGIGRGYYSQADFTAVQTRVDQLLDEAGVTLDGVYFCPHAPEDRCGCRKPETGMLAAAGTDCRWTDDSWMIGDKASDVQLALNGKLKPVLVLTGEGAAQADQVPDGTPQFVDLRAAIEFILAGDEP
jgi:lipopolysaccharide heptosyltransferase II